MNRQVNLRMYRKILILLVWLNSGYFIPNIAAEENTDELAQNQTPPRPTSPFESYISASGIVEPSSESIFVGTPVNRLVNKIFVKSGQKVKKGEILIKLEDLDLEADLKGRQVAYEIALANLKKLEAMPRKEDVVSAEAALQTAELELKQTRNLYERVQGLQDSRAMSQEEINRRLFNYQQAEGKWLQAKASLDKIKAGTWKPDLDIASLEVQQAKVQIDRINADIDRTIIRSPIDATVLQVKIHEGEFPLPDTSRNPILILGNTDEIHIRVSINQFEVPNFRPDASAVAYSQGDVRKEYPLEFVRLEPYLVGKQHLTHDILEKVDTRVLHVIYRFNQKPTEIFVGQQMDVYIDTQSSSQG